MPQVPVTADKPLNPRQQSFVNLYALGNLSATQAWIQAGYAPKTAKVQASIALTKPNIKAAVAERKQRLANTAGASHVTPEWISTRLAEIATDVSAPHAAQVSALRTLADFQGMLNGGQRNELPPALNELLGAIGAGYRRARALEEPAHTRTRGAVQVDARVIDDADDAEGTGTT